MFQELGSRAARRHPGGGTPSPMAHTLRSFSLPGSCAVSPRSVPSRCWLPLPRTICARRRAFPVRLVGSLNLRALSRQEIRCKRPGVAAKCCSLLPWAWILSGSVRGPLASGSEEPSALPCRDGGPRRGRRVGGGAGPSRLVAAALRRAPWCITKHRWSSEERRGAPFCAVASKSLASPARRPLRGGRVGRARGPARHPSEEGQWVGPWEASVRLSEEG